MTIAFIFVKSNFQVSVEYFVIAIPLIYIVFLMLRTRWNLTTSCPFNIDIFVKLQHYGQV